MNSNVEEVIEECRNIHRVSRKEAIAMLVLSGARRLRTQRFYKRTKKGAAAEERYQRRKARGLVRARRRRSHVG